MNALVSLHDISKHFATLELYTHFSLTIRKGEVIGLLGESGAGKSTFLKMLAGVEPVSSGRVALQAQRIGFVFQEPRLLPWRTALENIMIPLQITGTKKQALEKATYYIEIMGLKQFARAYPSELSGGMKQRVALARALAIEPDLLLCDEPLNALNLERRESIQALLWELFRIHSFALVYATHYPEEITHKADKILFFNRGTISQR
jgi:ABC-type nitrate/sulfonate/bicarbonate transport system ATPase subunit